jgi:ABC-type nickel/cobalt efflux system permease component RcnA
MSGSDPLPPEPSLEPVVDDGLGAIRVGLVAWALAGVVLLLRRDWLADRGTEWWLLVCLAGVVICLGQWAIFARHRANRRAREATSTGTAAGSPSGSPSGTAAGTSAEGSPPG